MHPLPRLVVPPLALSCLACSGLFTFPDPTPVDRIDLAAVPVPPLPERPPFAPDEDGRLRAEVSFSTPDAPGGEGTLWLYLPPGEHAEGSLPAVLIAPAGSTMLKGMLLGEGDRPEHLPYVDEGFAVVSFSLDGPDEPETFARAEAGLVNARNALRFLRERMPEVDPDRVFLAGHSSAGELALLAASHLEGVRGAAVYNAEGDGCWFQPQEALNTYALVVPDFYDFCNRTRARGHLEHLEMPLFLFASEADMVTSSEAIRLTADTARAQGADVTLHVVPQGGHYTSMIQEGVPEGIAWMKARIGTSAPPPSAPPTP